MSLPKLFERIFWHNNTTPAVNETNLNAMSKGLSDVDDRLISLGGLIMETVPEIQQDMEILGPAVESIDDNVAAAQASAETAEEQALKSEGFAVGEQDGVPVGSDSEYFENNAEYFANIANPPIRVIKDFAPIISITDAINKKARDVRIKVEPVQDLHGYTKPWVGGAGKNKLPNGITSSSIVTVNSDGSITLNGTTSAEYEAAFFNNGILLTGVSTYIASIRFPSYDSEVYMGIRITNADNQNRYLGVRTSDVAVELASGEYISRVYLHIGSGKTFNNTKIYPMIRPSGTSADYEQYENICPITGWSQIQLARVGIQQWDEEWEVGAIGGSTGDAVTYANRIRSKNFTPCKENTKYRVAIGFNVNLRIFWYDASKTYLGYDQVNASSGADITSREKAAFFKISTEGSTYGETYRSDISVNYPSTEHDYHAFKGNYYIILLNGMYYGARYDATSGEFVVDRGYKIYDGSSDEQWQHPSGWADGAYYINAALSDAVPVSGFSTIANIISNLGESQRADYLANGTKMGVAQGGNTNIYGSFGSEYNTEEKFRTFLSNNNMQVVYPLATPITLTKTALALELFFGNNTLYANSGDVALEYDASGIIHIAEAKLDIDVFKAVTAASSDFADFKSRVAAL